MSITEKILDITLKEFKDKYKEIKRRKKLWKKMEEIDAQILEKYGSMDEYNSVSNFCAHYDIYLDILNCFNNGNSIEEMKEDYLKKWNNSNFSKNSNSIAHKDLMKEIVVYIYNGIEIFYRENIDNIKELIPIISAIIDTKNEKINKGISDIKAGIEAIDNKEKSTANKKIISKRPEAISYFVGREQKLEQIRKILEDRNILFITGISGIGKSELVKKYINLHETNEKYKTIVFVDYDGNIKTTLINNIIITGVELVEEKIEEKYNQWLSNLLDLDLSRTLIVIDHADIKCEKFYSVIDKLASFGCKIIVTCIDNSYDSYSNLCVEDDEKLALNLFKQTSEVHDSDVGKEEKKLIDEIIKLADYHTMAVYLFALQYKKGIDSLKEYYDKLMANFKGVGIKVVYKKDHLEITKGNAYKFICSLFDMSNINEEQLELLKVLSLVPVSGIEIKDLKEALDYSGDLIETIDGLQKYAWLIRENNRVHLHSLVSEIVLNENNLSIEEVNINKYINYIFISIEKNKDNYEVAKDYIELLIVFINKRVDVSYLDRVGRYNRSATILINYGYYYLAIEVLKEAEKKYDNNDIELFNVYNNFASVYNILENKEMEYKYISEAFKLTNTSSKIGNDEKISISFRYAESERTYGNFDNSYKILRKSLDYTIDEQIKVCIYISIAFICKENMQFERAIDYFNMALNNNTSDLFNLVRTYRGMAATYSIMGNLLEAKKCIHKANELSNRIYPEAHSEVVALLNCMGDIYYKAKEYEKALESYKKAKLIYIKLGLPNNSDYVQILNNIFRANIEIKGIKGNEDIIDKFWMYLKEARIIINTSEVVGFRELAETYFNIAIYRFYKKHFKKAKENIDKAIEIFLEKYGELNFDVANCYYFKGRIYYEQKNYEQALDNFREAKKIIEKLEKYEIRYVEQLKDIDERIDSLNNKL